MRDKCRAFRWSLADKCFLGRARRRVIKTSHSTPSPTSSASSSPAFATRTAVLLPWNGRRNELEKDRERCVFLARFKQPGRFSSTENAAFKSRSASFPHRKSSSWFLFFSHSKRSGCLRERINGEGANGDVQSTGRIVRGRRVAHEGGREAGVKRGVGVVYLRLKRRISRDLRRDSLLKMSFKNRGRRVERRVFEI